MTREKAANRISSAVSTPRPVIGAGIDNDNEAPNEATDLLGEPRSGRYRKDRPHGLQCRFPGLLGGWVRVRCILLDGRGGLDLCRFQRPPAGKLAAEVSGTQ